MAWNPPRRRRGLDDDEIVRRYLSGEHSTDIARDAGVTPPIIAAVLRRHGIAMRGRSTAISDDELLAAVAAFHAETGTPLTGTTSGHWPYSAYGRWAREAPGRPCVATIRNRLSWRLPLLAPDPHELPATSALETLRRRYVLQDWLSDAGVPLSEIAAHLDVDISAVSVSRRRRCKANLSWRRGEQRPVEGGLRPDIAAVAPAVAWAYANGARTSHLAAWADLSHPTVYRIIDLAGHPRRPWLRGRPPKVA